jgi:hypothetical protein
MYAMKNGNFFTAKFEAAMPTERQLLLTTPGGSIRNTNKNEFI